MDAAHRSYDVMHAGSGAPIKMWTRGVPVDESSKRQLLNTATMPFIYKWLAVMPDVHFGKGSTIGSVIPTKGAIIPAAVGVDIGCGMMAVRTSLTASDLPDDLAPVRSALEKAVPHGRTTTRGKRDKGAWENPRRRRRMRGRRCPGFKAIIGKHPKLAKANTANHLGTLGTGNHFLEVCLDRGGPRLGDAAFGLARRRQRHRQLFHRAAPRRTCASCFINLPDAGSRLSRRKGREHFDDYVGGGRLGAGFRHGEPQVMMRHASMLCAARSRSRSRRIWRR